MPRTKVVKKLTLQPNNNDETRENCNKIMEIFEQKINAKKKETDELIASIYKDFDTKMRLIISSLPKDIENKTLVELKNDSLNIPDSIIELSAKSLMNATKSVQKSKRSRRSISTGADDEGYLTAGSETGTKRTSRTRSKTIALRTTTKRVSRSLSRSKMQTKTPLHKMPPPNLGYVTPKIKPNTPQVVLRRPVQGETVISMSGSPLMVNGVITDLTANVNIPLNDGRLLSIQPERGIRLSQIPTIDFETKCQLETLRDNLNAVLKRRF